MATLEIKNDLDSFKQSLTRKATTKIPVVKNKPKPKDVNLTTIQAQARTPVFKSVTTPRKYTTPTKKPKIELPKYTPFTQEEVGLLQHQTRLPMALPKSNLTSKAATNTEYALKSNPTAYGFMEGFSPLATKKQLSKQLGQEIDTTGAEDTLGYKVGYGAGLMGQYAITGGIAHAGVRQGLTRMIPQLANQAGRSTVKNVLGTMGASALTDVLTGVPVNTLQAIKESTIDNTKNNTIESKGNIDLYNRPQIKNPDGSISTVYSMTFTDDEGKFILVPGVRDGLDRVMTEKEAWDYYNKTGEYLGKFDTLEEADDYAEKLHQQQDAYYTNTSSIDWGKFAKSFAVNTAIDVVFGGLIEGAIVLKSGKKIKTVDDVANLSKEEGQEFKTLVEKLAYESNVRKGKITQQNNTLYGNAFTQSTGELPAPKIEYEDVLVGKIVQKKEKYIDNVYTQQYNNIDSIKKQLSKYYVNGDDGASNVASEAIADLKKAESGIYNRNNFEGQGKIIGRAFSDELIDTGRINLSGIKFKNVDDLAAISHVYRDPRFETFRIIYTKGNEVVDIDAVSSRLPGSSRAFVTDTRVGVRKMKEKMQRVNADGYYLLHNHPSGNVKPSQEDINTTSRILTGVKGFRSHIIINSNKFTEVFQNSPHTLGSRENVPLDLGWDVLTEQSKPHPMIGTLIDSADTFAKIAKQMQLDSQNQSVVFFVSSDGRIKTIMEVDNRFMNNNPIEFKNFVKNRAIDNGGSSSFIQLGENANEKLAKEFVENGIFTDALKKDGTSIRTQGVVDKTLPNDWMEKDTTNIGFKVKTAKTKIDPMHNKLKKVNAVEKVVERRQKPFESYINNRSNREMPYAVTRAELDKMNKVPQNIKTKAPNATKIPTRELVKPVEPLKADKPTVAPKAKTIEPKATKTVDAKVDSMGGEKSFFNKIDDVTERNKAKEKLSEKIKFTNKEGRQVTKTRKDYIEDASSIYGSHIETIKRQTTDFPTSSTLYEYRLYKRPTSTKFTKLSKYEKEYFEYAKSKQPEMPKIFTEKTSFNKKPFKETPLTNQSPPKPKPKPDVSELVLTSVKESRKPRKERLYDAGLDTKRKMVDSGDTVAVISKITGDDSIYHAYNKARSASRTGEHMIGEAQVNIKGDVVGESLESIFKPIIDKGDGYYKEFETYLLHKLNVDRMAQGKPVFGEHITADMSIRDADRLLREYPEFEQLAQKVYKYNRNIMQYRIDAGLVTLDEANMWANMYPHYVLIARMEKSSSKVAAHAKTQKTKKISKTVMEAVGDDTKIVPIHVSMSRQTMRVVKEAETNLFANRLVDSASVKTAKYLQDSTLMKKGVPLEDLIEGELPYLKNGFHLFRDGKVYEVKVDEGLFEAIQTLSPSAKSPNIMYEGAMFVNKTFKQLVTSYSPPFLIKNFVRDVPDAMLYSIDSKEFIKQFPKAMKEIKTNGPLWQKYKAMGGMSSSFFDYAKGYKGDSSFIRRNTVDRIEHLNMLTEQLPRFTEFMVTLSKGDKSYDNFLEALFNSADVTVNFGKKGTWGKVINETAVPFFNPSIQGFDKAIRFFKNNKGAKRWAVVIKKAALLGIAPSVINEIIYGNDPSYQKLRNRDKDLHYIFKVGEDFWLRVPKGRVISVIGGIPQRTVRKIRGEENAYADFLKSSAEQIAPVSPLTSNLYSPIIHAETNKAWHGGAIVPYGLVNKAAEKQFDEGTTSMSKWLGGKLKYSPKKIDYLVDAYTGIIGDLAMPLMTKKADMHPFIKAFTIDGVTSNKISHTFYEKKTEVSQLEDEGYVVGYIQNRYLGKQASMVSKLFDEITEIQLSNMSDTEKYTKVRELRALINGVQQNALDSLTEIEKATKKLEKKYEDSDDLYREVNKEVFGAEYALEMYNKQIYEKAKEAVKASGLGKKVTYEQYYKGYFAQKDKPSDIGKAVALKSENIDTLFVAFDISDKNARIGAAIYENDLSYIYETTYRRIGENNATKSAEKIAIIRQHNPNLTRQQLNILYEAFNVAESIGGYRRQFK